MKNPPTKPSLGPRPLRKGRRPKADVHWRSAASVIVLAIAALLLFTRLGHYALWDDEAATALTGESVWRTGDTSALQPNNIFAYRNGQELSGFKVRFLSPPPVQYYLAAPFVGVWPGSTFAARLPFAILGLLTVALILWWMHRDRAGDLLWVLMVMGLIGNVEFWLYCRQCRYYGPVIFLSVAIVYLYLHYQQKWWEAALIGFSSAALIASNYLSYPALYGILAVDWLIWGKARFRPDWRGWLWVWAPQLLLGGLVVWIWYPLGHPLDFSDESSGLFRHVMAFCWFLRDINRCEFVVWILIAAAPLVWLRRREIWLLRAPLALAGYIVIWSALSPQPTWILRFDKWYKITQYADVRYLCPIIPLAIVIAALVLATAFGRRLAWVAICVAVVAFYTNALQGGKFGAAGWKPSEDPVIRSTFLEYIGELTDPPPDPYSAAIEWINAHVRQGQSIIVLPEGMEYALMYQSPQVTYGWQFEADRRADYPTLPAIDFKFGPSPDYYIVFGKGAPPAETLHPPGGHAYVLIKVLDVYGPDLFRPELMVRTFRPIVDFDPMAEGIRIYRRL